MFVRVVAPGYNFICDDAPKHVPLKQVVVCDVALEHNVVQGTAPKHSAKHAVICGVTSDQILVRGIVYYECGITCGTVHILLFTALASIPKMTLNMVLLALARWFVSECDPGNVAPLDAACLV